VYKIRNLNYIIFKSFKQAVTTGERRKGKEMERVETVLMGRGKGDKESFRSSFIKREEREREM